MGIIAVPRSLNAPNEVLPVSDMKALIKPLWSLNFTNE